jgi:hypothetical protein
MSMRDESSFYGQDELHQPVFIHGWWRAATTYLFAKLRAKPGLRCYYEPLHEKVAHLTLDEARAAPQTAGYRTLRHPALDRHYWAEYEALIASGSTGFHPALSYERYLLQPDESAPDLEAYLARLVAAARRERLRAVLSFVRSPMRSLWMKRRFGGLHVAQIRNPHDQWRSFNGRVGSYFVDGTACIASGLRERFPHAFAHLARVPDLPGAPLMPRAIRAEGRGFIRIGSPVGAQRHYAVFLMLWFASALQSLSAADIVFDCDRLSSDPGARARIGAQFAAAGLPIELDDIAAPSSPEAAPGVSELVESLTLRQLGGDARTLVIADPDRIEAALDHLSSASASLLKRALAALRA